MERVIRKLSKAPCSTNWRDYVKVADQLSSLDPAHPLFQVASLTFNELYHRHASELLQYGIVAGELLLTFSEPSFKNGSPGICDAMLLALRARCTAVRYLRILGFSNDFVVEEILILKATRGRLRKLTAKGNHAAAIEKYCNGLEELLLKSVPGTASFLRTAGPTLKILEIGVLEIPRGRIPKSWRSIYVISVPNFVISLSVSTLTKSLRLRNSCAPTGSCSWF